MRRSIVLSCALLTLTSLPALAEQPADVAAAPGAETFADDDGLWVRRHLKLSLDAQGRVTREVEQALKPLTDYPMREDMLDPFIDWDDARTELEVERVVTWMADGTEVEALDNSMVPNTDGELQWAVPYAHMRRLTVAHVGVEHGSTSLLRYRITDRGPTGAPMWGVQPLADFMPILSQRVVLEVPEGTPLHWGVLDGDANPLVDTSEGVLRLAFQEVVVDGLVLAENHGQFGVPRLVWSTARDWKHTRSFLEAQVVPSIVADSYVQAKVRELLDGSLDRPEQLARLHDFVVDGLRSIHRPAVDFSYSTRSAPEVLNSSVGHALDKAVLLVAMLRSAGFTAQVALASPQRGYLPDVPSPVPFSQVWVRVQGPGHAIWLDPTTAVDQHNGYHLAGHPVLVLDGEAEAPELLPELSPQQNQANLWLRVELGDGEDVLAASGHGDLGLYGTYNPVLGFDRGEDRLSGLADGLAAHFGGAEHQSCVGQHSTGVVALGAEFSDGSIEIPASGLVRLVLPRVPGALSAQQLEAWRPERSLPLELTAAAQEQVTVTWVLPEGWQAVALPAAVNVDNPLGSYQRQVRVEDGEISVHSRLLLRTARVGAADWPQLRALLLAAEPSGGVLLQQRAGGDS